MILEIGGRKLDLGENNTLKIVFPLTCNEQQMFVSTTIEAVEGEEMIRGLNSCPGAARDDNRRKVRTARMGSSIHGARAQREREKGMRASARGRAVAGRILD